MSREELRWLYASADAFVLPTRGEGWCLPAMEAMAMSLPVILSAAPRAAAVPSCSHLAHARLRRGP